MSPTLTTGVERVTLIGPSDPAGGAFWLWAAGIFALCMLLGGLVSFMAWRDRARSDPEDRAFVLLSRRLRLGRSDCSAIRQAARQTGMPPVAVLLSEAAFDRAFDGTQPPGAADLRRCLFSSR